MLRLGILGLGLVSAMVVLDCGGRTPLQDEDLFGAPGSITATGNSGTSSVGPGFGGTVTTGGTGVAGGSSVGGSGIAGDLGFGGTSLGTGGTVTIGTGGASGVGGTIAAGGSPGFGGAGGAVGVAGAGGTIGVAGAGGGPNPVRQLVNDLPGTRVSPDCIACATTCQGSDQCAANATCAAALACAAASCGVMNRNPGGGCLLKCANGDPQLVVETVSALLCVYDTCARTCVAGRMR